MRPEDQEKILSALAERVTLDHQKRADSGGFAVHEILEDSLYHERRRLKDTRPGKTKDADAAFWEQVQKELRQTSSSEHATILQRASRRYGEEIAGNFDDRVYQAVTKALPPVLGLLLNAVSPMKLVGRLPTLPKIDDAVVIGGEVEQLHRLHEKGTVILVPTHVSNLDSMIIGFALFRLGLPPFIYGAGLNLFTNPLLSFFMHNLGAYTVDRKKTDPLYKATLKEYATLTLEHGYDNLFFPGGTRSRSGAIEKHLKLGLAGTGLSAYINNLRRGAPRPKVYFVPATLSFQLVLEAETLIDDFLKEVGKARYIIDDDEFARPKRVFDFLSQLLGLDSKIHVTICRGYDTFGNPVDENGESLDPCGRAIDTARYVLKGGEPAPVGDRDIEYTREVGLKIADEFIRNNVVESTHVTARAIFDALRQANPKANVLRIIRTGGAQRELELAAIYREVEQLLGKLRALADRSGIRLGPSTQAAPEEVVADGLAHFAIYHNRTAATRKGASIIPTDRTLLFYYQNRLEGYGLERGQGRKPLLSSDHRTLAEA